MSESMRWAEFLSGSYWGHFRDPGEEDWADFIGLVTLECTLRPDGKLSVILTNPEFGTWTGEFRPDDRVLEGRLGSDNACFTLKYKAVPQPYEERPTIHVGFLGGLYGSPDRLSVELRFSGYDARDPRDEP